MKRTIAADFEFMEQYGKVLGPYGLAVYSGLWHYADDTGTCWPTYQTLSDLIGVSKRKVVKEVYRLEELKLVKLTPRIGTNGTTSNLYRLLSLK